MRRSILATVIALVLALGTLPAYADTHDADGDEGTTTETESETSGSAGFADLFDAIFGEAILGEGSDESLPDLGLGFGAAYRLFLYAAVTGIDPLELLAASPGDSDTDEYDFAWGVLKKTLDEDALDALAEYPRNFGQAVSADRRHQGRDKNQPEHAGNRGRPDHAGGKKGGSDS